MLKNLTTIHSGMDTSGPTTVKIAPTTPVFALAAIIALTATLPGCVRRTLVITTEPSKALVFLNDQEIGRTKVTTDFLWYGDYDVVIRKPGYKTLHTHWDVKAQWYQIIPIDFFAEVLWPGNINDVHTRHFALDPQELPSSEELLERAAETREEALNTPS